jgi:hypothetical protein
MKSESERRAMRVYQHERAAAYLDFYQELERVAKLTRVHAIILASPLPGATQIDNLISDSSGVSRSRFERALFALYERLIFAHKKFLLDADLATSTVIRRLEKQVESMYRGIYWEKIEVFAQRAGFHADKAFPEPYLRLLAVNARGSTSRLFSQLEDEILAREVTSGGELKTSSSTSPPPQVQLEATVEKDNSTPPPDNNGSLDFASEAGRINAIAAYTKRWKDDSGPCPEASLARTAIVHPADLSKWKKGSLPAGSDKKRRIEKALTDNARPTPAGERES